MDSTAIYKTKNEAVAHGALTHDDNESYPVEPDATELPPVFRLPENYKIVPGQDHVRRLYEVLDHGMMDEVQDALVGMRKDNPNMTIQDLLDLIVSRYPERLRESPFGESSQPLVRPRYPRRRWYRKILFRVQLAWRVLVHGNTGCP